MQYNFDEIIDRSKNYAAKREEAHLHYGTNDVIPLWIADMDFRTAQPIIDAIKERADQGIFGYTFRPDSYFESVAAWQERRNGYRPKIEKIAFALGVVPAMRFYIELFTEPDAKILIQQPVYHPFEDIVLNTGRELIINELQRDESGFYTIDFADFEEKIKQGVEVFILCNPHNPVGRVWTKEELEQMGNICAANGVRILSDEIHSDLMLHGNKHTLMESISAEIEEITTTFIAPSKTFNLAGLQSSSVVFDTVEHKEAYVAMIRRMDIARNNCFSLVATMAAYEKGEEWLEQLLMYVGENLRFIQEYCAAHIPVLKPNAPQATYLSWIDARGLGMDDVQLRKFTVEKAGLALGGGRDFGESGSGFLRLNAACPRPVLKKAMDQLRSAVEMIK